MDIQQQKIISALENITERLSIRRFLRPDGIARLAPDRPLQPFDRLLFVTDGVKCERMSLGGVLHGERLAAGDAYLIGKEVWEDGSWSSPHHLVCIVPRRSYLRISSYTVETPERPENFYFHSDRPCPEALNAVFSALKNLEEDAFAAALPLVRAAAEIALAEARRPNTGGGKALATFERLRTYLEYHLQEPLSREGLARRFRLNPSYVSGLFRRYLGKSFQDYLTECRLEMAHALLRDPQLGIKEIAERCGFHSDVYFIRRFREVVGVTPGACRLRLRPEPVSARRPGPDPAGSA